MLKNTLDYRMVRKNKKFVAEDKAVRVNRKKENDGIKKIKTRKRERIRVRKK